MLRSYGTARETTVCMCIFIKFWKAVKRVKTKEIHENHNLYVIMNIKMVLDVPSYKDFG